MAGDDAARREYLRAGRAYAVAQNATKLQRQRRPWLIAGAGATVLVMAGAAALGWFVGVGFLMGLFAIIPMFVAVTELSDANNAVRKAARTEFEAKLDYQEAAAEFLGIEPPMPEL
jgi:alkanesulfonate monooxygenase SsuD/methylene tetrahydromethanopterin reductase-like flavin-dependent oxidoreductase (luciferase family)